MTNRFKNLKSYSLRVVTDWLDKNPEKYKYKINSNSVTDNYSLYKTGLYINGILSVQTSPTVAGPAFAETMDLTQSEDVDRWKTPDELFNYITDYFNEQVNRKSDLYAK